MAQLWRETLAEIGEERFDAALAQVMRETTFRPDIALIRLAAGVNRGIVDPTVAEATAALQVILAAMRTNTHRLKRMEGKVLRDRDVEGRRLEKSEIVREPDLPAPVFSERVEAAIVLVGYGDRQAGLMAISEHPALYGYWLENGKEIPDRGYAEKNARDIEARWLRAYREGVPSMSAGGE